MAGAVTDRQTWMCNATIKPRRHRAPMAAAPEGDAGYAAGVSEGAHHACPLLGLSVGSLNSPTGQRRLHQRRLLETSSQQRDSHMTDNRRQLVDGAWNFTFKPPRRTARPFRAWRRHWRRILRAIKPNLTRIPMGRG